MKHSKHLEINEKNKSIVAQIENYSRNSALIFIILGALHLFVPYLDFYWGILLLVLGFFCFFVKKKSTILIAGIALILVGFFNGLSLLLGYVEPANVKWALFGIIQVALGIGELIRYFKIRKIPITVKTNRLVEIIGYVLLIVALIVYVYMSWLHVPEYTLLKDINGKQIEIPVSECVEPYVENGDRCCIMHEEYNWLCKDEGEDYGKKWKIARETNSTTNQAVYNENLNLFFETPEGYMVIEDSEEGGKPVPYVFEAYLFDNGNYTGDSIYITFLDYREDNFTYSDWKYFISLIEEESPDAQITETENAKGYRLLIVNSLYRNEETNSIVYEKSVIFTDYNLLIRFEGIDSGKDYVNEFDRLIDSIRFTN